MRMNFSRFGGLLVACALALASLPATAQVSALRLTDQVLNDKGKPVVNGYVYIGTYGQDPVANPLSLFSDSGLTTPIANPQRTDSFGRPVNDIYIAESRYSYQLKDSTSVSIEGPKNRVAPASVTGVVSKAATIAALKALTGLTDGQLVEVACYYTCTTPDGGGGKFKWDAASSATDNGGTIIAPDAGGVGRWRRVYSGAINVKWFGAKGDASFNDQPAIQAAVDLFGRATGVITRGEIFFPAGIFVINSSVVAEDQALSFQGVEGTIIRWNGNNTTPMFDMIDCSRVRWDTMTLLGKDASQPTAGIFFNETIVSNLGSNEFFIINNVQFGRRHAADTTAAGKMQRGVYMNGSTESDTFKISNSQFHDCTTACIDNDNGNAIWGMLENITFNACAYGLKVGGDTFGVNLNFNRCTTADVYAYREIQVVLTQVNSEHSVLPFKVEQGASLHVRGGRLNVMAELTGTYWADLAGARDVSFRDYWVFENGASGKKLRHTGSSLARGILYIRSSEIAGGDDGSAFEFAAEPTSLGVDVDIQHGPYGVKKFSRYNFAYNPTSLTDGNFDKEAVSAIAGSDIAAGSMFVPSFSLDLQGITFTGEANASQSLTAMFQNESGGTVDLAGGTIAWRPIDNKEIARFGTATFAPADQSDGRGVTTTITVPGAALGDFAYWSDTADTQNWIVTAYVSAANTIAARYQNENGGVIGKASGTLKLAIIRETAFDYLAAATFDPANLADGAGETTTVSCPGATLGDFVLASFSNDLQGITMTPWVSAANTCSIRFQNQNGLGTAIDLASGTLRAGVFKKN